jgi:ABC-type transporter Mla subunit MlaD
VQVGEAFVAVRPDTSKFGPELQQGVETSGRQAASGLSQALTAGIAVAGFSKLIGSASDLNESMNKTRATFGEASTSVEAFASTSANSFGISEAAALDLAGGLGAMLIPLGTSQEEAAGMSTTLLELAADMGSFNNQDPTAMLDRLRSGLAGEAEPLRQFGVTLSEARVQQFAWANGIAESGVALTEQQKIMARYGIILQDTATQQGDFTRTSDEAANAQRRAAATAEDSAASIGSNFLPVYKSALAGVNALAGAFGALPGPLQTAGVLLLGFAAFKGPLTGMFSAVTAGVKAMAENFKAAGGGVRGLGQALSAGTIIGGIAVVGLGLITNAMAKQAQTAEETRNRVKGLADAYTEGGIAAAGQTFLSQISEDAPEVLDALDSLDGGIGQFVTDIGEGGDTAADAIRSLGAAMAGVPLETWDTFMRGTGGFIPGDQQGAILEAQHALNQFVDPLTQAATASQELTGRQEEVAEATGTASDALDEQAAALSEIADSADSARDSLDALFGVQKSFDEAAVAVQATTDDLSQSLRDNGRSFNIATAAGRANYAAARAAAEAVAEYTIAARANGDTVQQAAGKGRALTGSLRETLRAAGMTRGETDRLIATYARVPRQLLTDVVVTGADAAVAAIQRVYSAALRAASAVNQISGSLAGGGAYGNESFAVGTTTTTNEAFPVGGGTMVHVTVNGSVVGDVDRFADEIAYRAAEKLGKAGVG